jgi:hypothetical protein
MNQTQICNLALSALGARDTIASINETSNEAVQCNTHWAQAVDITLAAAAWAFARRSALLTLVKSAPGTPEFIGTPSTTWLPSYPSPPWLYSYVLPTDCIMPRYVLPAGINSGGFPVPLFSVPMEGGYQVSGAPIKFITTLDYDLSNVQFNALLTDVSPAILVYTARAADTNFWDPRFVEALSLVLASRICFSITGDRALQESLAKQALMAIQTAKVDNANEGITVHEITPDWLAIRGVGPLDDLLPPGSVN